MNNSIKNTANPNRLIPGPYVNPTPSENSKGTESNRNGSSQSVRNLD